MAVIYFGVKLCFNVKCNTTCKSGTYLIIITEISIENEICGNAIRQVASKKFSLKYNFKTRCRITRTYLDYLIIS